MDIEVNYRNKKRYKTARYPLHQGFFWTWLIWLLSKIALLGKEYKVEKINMEGLKPPLYAPEQPYAFHRFRTGCHGYVSLPREQCGEH